MKRLTLSLLENAHDFILTAAEHAKKHDSRSWKYAIIHLASGLELLLKARLQQEHWSLLFADVDQASNDKMQQGDFVSVDPKTTIKRLKNISNLCLPEKAEKDLEAIRKNRNKVIHFTIDIDISELKALVAVGINIFIEFYKNNFDKRDDYFIYELSRIIVEFEEFVSQRLSSLRDTLSNSEMPPVFCDCPLCRQETLIVDHDHELIKCLFCLNELPIVEFAEYHSESIVGICPECKHKSLAYISLSSEDTGFRCVICDYQIDSAVFLKALYGTPIQ